MYMYICRAYFRKAGHACGMTKIENILITLGQFDDKTPLNRMQIKSFWSKKKLKEIQKGHSVQVTHVMSA